MRKFPGFYLAILQSALLLSVPTASHAQEAVAIPAPGGIGPYFTEDVPRLPPVGQDSVAPPDLIPGTASRDLGGDTRSPGPRPGGPPPDSGMRAPGMGPPGGGGPFRYSAIWLPSTSVHGQDAKWGLVGQDLSVMCPVWMDGTNRVMFMGGVSNRLIQTDAVLPDTGQPYPSELWNTHVGLMFNRQLDNGWMAGGGVNLGSASDRPFGALRDMNIGMNAMLRVPQGEHNAWMFSLMYSPMSEIPFPIPGVAFNWNPSEQFHANIGIPFQVTYRPTDDWTFEVMYMPIHTIHAKATYRFSEQIRAFASYDWANEVYALADRVEDNERFFMYDQRAALGLEATLVRFATVDVTGGYAFDRYSYEGSQTSAFNATQINRVDIGTGPFTALQLKLRF
ncbi:MAG: DUF6268 family outer membrane beta-barrel protein [Planctomycetota bacterium]